ncbi:TetR/AcrR family transcriptional regulator [Streptomyces sp. NBC_01476]|uniref:TetR/AcrR family transcriptional regulator n=1 Tax=Streptomyces sp. NBC_01476 TaxID=2903881 RepID=UPI002E32CE82|nr:TetR/AcrR family transcriptional regulator [Streptomyces sp. NBC_01476]
MPTYAAPQDKVRDRVLDAACELFAARGINTTGVDLIAEVAGVSKRSLYQRFASKDDLIAAYLPVATDRFLNDLIPPADAGLSPVESILRVFTASQRASLDPGFGGCPVLNASAEIRDATHPLRSAAVAYKDRLQEWFAAHAEAAGATDPVLLAEQLAILFDGAMSYTSVRARPIPDSVYVTARALLTAQGLPLPAEQPAPAAS